MLTPCYRLLKKDQLFLFSFMYSDVIHPLDTCSIAHLLNRGITANCWFATMRQGGHVGGQYNRIFFFRRIYLKMELSSQRREMLLFLATNMADVTSRAIQQYSQDTQVVISLICSIPDWLLISL